MTDHASTIRDRAASVLDGGRRLAATPTEERAAWLAAAADRLAREAFDAREPLAVSTGLSAPMVEWGARTTLDTIHVDALRSLARDATAGGGEPLSMVSLVLAGNLFTASVRAVFVPLLLGVPVLAKASSREITFAAMLVDALRCEDPTLGEAVDLAVFPGGDAECEAALIEPADAVAVYGGDDTIAAIRARHSGTPLIAHGHGVSTAYCARAALEADRIEDSISALALDICAYDQRGCLSPQIVYVDESPKCSAVAFAERLAADGLEPMRKKLPRGPLPLEVGAAQAQWRGIAEVEGTLIAGAEHSVAVRPADPIRWSPAYRNVTVAPVLGLTEAVHAMEALGPSLKCIGTDEASLIELNAQLSQSSTLDAYACPLATMQTPALDAPADGKPIWRGLLR